ncbi:transcription factor bye1 [Acrodontium crateriforme]|uniref:Transcription factor BYE1 n=1 Tax=Acrodontium crateriforme TaxID=150365 RepID=A0AAQ3R7I4_9PEZI|nr:transcription factor bye1 [Acrodontium crateriforme]
MADEPRRSGRATKGQHKNASSSPAPTSKPTKASKPKPSKKATEPEPDDEGDEEEEVRCICGNNDPEDKRTFIGCDACSCWQHNVCMGMPDDEDDIPEHYFCEQCRPEEHQETVQALAKGEPIWEVRNKVWQNEKKSKNRKKGKNDKAPPGWLKKDVAAEKEEQPEPAAPVEAPETGNKRKREEDIKEESQTDTKEETKRNVRQEKRRKSSPQDVKESATPDPDTALVDISKLPSERQKVAQALSKIITEDVQARAKAGFKLRAGETAKSIGDHHAARIEYGMHMNFGAANDTYKTQFRSLHANLKKNKLLIERLLNGSLTADELSTMESKDMASEELQKERAELKAELDRQAIALKADGPQIRRTHKGDEIIEDENQIAVEAADNSAPVRQRASVVEEGAGSPAPAPADGALSGGKDPLAVNTERSPNVGHGRRESNQNFDMNNIWAKTAQSPTSGTPPTGARPMQVPPRRRSSIQARPDQPDGAKHDPDVDRMLEDNDEPYSPTEFTSDETIVWRGKLVQSSGEGEPVVNARFVAGRDLASTIAWKDLIPDRLSIDGRLAIPKAEDYLCSLEWSTSSDVSVLALTPFDNAEAFNAVFNYFKSRERYAVVNKHTPPMVKDLYIIPLAPGDLLPSHIGKLEHCTLKLPLEQNILLATFVVARAPGEPSVSQKTAQDMPSMTSTPAHNGNHHIPSHLRQSIPGPAGSPITAQTPVFSPVGPPNNGAPNAAGYGVPPPSFPPNPYAQQYGAQPAGGPPFNPLVNEILGPLQHAPTAMQILAADPAMGRDKLVNLQRILFEHEEARTDIDALAKRLFSGS